MKKLTAGIFAGILTIVTVNAADAAIASKAYVDQQRDANKALINTNAGDITELTTVVGASENAGLQGRVGSLESVVGDADSGLVKTVGNDTAGLVKDVADLRTKVGDLAGEGTGTVADQIAAALEPYSTTVQADGKYQAKSSADYSLGTQGGEWKALTEGELSALQSGIKGADVTQITTNKNDIAGINTKLGNVPADKDVVTMIGEATTAAGNAATKTDFDELKGKVDDTTTGLAAAHTAISTLDSEKQDLLNGTNVVVAEGSTGNAVTAVTAADGVVTVTKGNVMPVVPAGQTLDDGTLVLTAKVVDGSVTYGWEAIQREDITGGSTGNTGNE